MKRIVCVGCALAMGFIASVGCKDRQACEQSRLKMMHTWEDVKHTAAARKVPASYEQLSHAEKTLREERWAPIELQAETLRSSFETPQITWDAADRAREIVEAKYAEIPREGPLVEGFGRQLASANVQYEELRKQCR